MNYFIYPFTQSIHPLAIEICHKLQQAGYQAYIVGGCVRDLYLEVPPKDWDITSDATPEKIMELFPKNIPTGLKHGTVTVCMGEGVENHFEVTTFRIEGEYLDGRRPEEVKFVNNIVEDLSRRDFTINAMAFDPIANISVDPFNGKNDLQHHLITAVRDPNARFQEDGLRIMRAARFAAKLCFDIEPLTLQGMTNNIDTLKKISKERINDELCKILMAKDPVKGLTLLKEVGALSIICPHLMSHPILTGFLHKQNECVGELETRVAYLYSNCQQTAKVKQELIDLKFSNKSIKRITLLLLLLDEAISLYQANTKENYISLMAYIKNNDPDWESILEQFFLLTDPMPYYGRMLFQPYEKVIVLARREMQLNGDDLLDIGIKSGPFLKELLDKCYLEILQHPEHNDKQYLLDMVRKTSN